LERPASFYGPALSGYNAPMCVILFGGALTRRCFNWKKWATADA
jgi:hypothetical protein